ncbi:hypothetical protein PMZ80_007395 [Knufia obscura]|uniref:ABM domain-containing protein n=2 Tax=Knufia TaxID=430999 RepID=A0AAN8EGV5_9EURO|nr:hypothetical protein PMZ80_007395 [Knufia obscura]KAK5950517.1 hypothetical protein OHC33_008460 [Knufia fluminis]
MSERNIFAMFKPKAGKVQRLRELINNQAKDVHEKEDYCNRFVVTEQLDSTPTFIIFETYKDLESVHQHAKEPHFQALMKALDEEDLLMEKPFIAYTKSTGGFEMDRKLL